MICMCCTCTYAQTSVNVKSSPSKISGSVRDASSGEALIQCSVQLLDSDSTFISGAATDMNGGFAINVSKNGKYILKCSYVGYTDTYKNVEVSGRQKIMPLGTISMSEDAVMLEGAVVKGTIPQVEVVEDTVQYNAAAFRVPEGSAVEELIKKLPGAEVDESGKITINGREISKILVDGKEFFSSQTDMAMKNLPAEIIDKVKTYDKKSDLARITGIDDGEEETVIDLTVKKDKKNGWIGNVRASGGTHSLHSERFNLNHFTDDVKLSLIEKASADALARANNIVRNAGGRLGRVMSARLGVFQITGANTNEEFSAGGSFNTTNRNKKARVTIRVEYRVK